MHFSVKKSLYMSYTMGGKLMFRIPEGKATLLHLGKELKFRYWICHSKGTQNAILYYLIIYCAQIFASNFPLVTLC